MIGWYLSRRDFWLGVATVAALAIGILRFCQAIGL